MVWRFLYMEGAVAVEPKRSAHDSHGIFQAAVTTISMVRIALCQSTDDFEISLGVTTMNDSKDSRKVRQKGTSKGSKQTFSRAKLVGKFPHIRHQPAPKAVYKLDEDVRTAMVDRMMLK